MNSGRHLCLSIFLRRGKSRWCTVIEGIPKCFRNRLRPLCELLPIRCISGDVAFIDTTCPHCAPLVVVTAQPDLREVGERPVFSDVTRREMTMIVNDGEGFSKGVVQLSCRFALQQEIVMDKFSVHSGLSASPDWFIALRRSTQRTETLSGSFNRRDVVCMNEACSSLLHIRPVSPCQ